MSKPSREWIFWALVGVSITAWIASHFSAVMACIGECYVDLGSIHGYPVAYLEFDDTRLNTWILAWSQHALTSPGTSLFDANAFYPAPHALAGSEHLLGQALISLPLRAFTDNAILIYGVMLIASYAILGFSTVICVRWLTGSHSIAIFAGIVAMAMPWREAELSHLQLLSACWFPLIICLALRLLGGEGSRRDSAVLTGVLTLQLLSSYYLAYMITFTLAVTSTVVIATLGIDRRSLAKLIPAALVPYGILALVSIPYLLRATRGEIIETLDPERPLAGDHLGNAIEMFLPRFNTLWQQNPGFDVSFFIPATLLALALVALAWLPRSSARLGGVEGTKLLRVRTACIALWLACLVSFVMTLGSHLALGEESFRLPGYWAALLLPGFSNLRAPHRWGIVIGTMMPVLAALGAAWLMELRRFSSSETNLRWRLPVGVLLGLLVVINLPWKRLPAYRASNETPAWARFYEKLSELPFGAVLEMPWPLNSLNRTQADTRYMVASTRHWRPLLNGFTAHLPPSFFLLNRVAQDLPGRSAVERLGSLTDLRWIAVHWDEMPIASRGAWRTRTPGGLRVVFENAEGTIFEIPEAARSGRWMQALVENAPHPRTLTGLTRESISIDGPGGGILSLEPGPPFRYMGRQPLVRPLRVEIENPGKRTWPGLDVQPEGLVQLRYAFSDLQDRLVKTDLAALDADLPPGVSRVSPVIAPPARAGRYRFCALRRPRVRGRSDGRRPEPPRSNGTPGGGVSRVPEKRPWGAEVPMCEGARILSAAASEPLKAEAADPAREVQLRISPTGFAIPTTCAPMRASSRPE